MKAWYRILFVCALPVGLVHGTDAVRRIELPAETEVFKPTDAPGYAFVNASCLTCHSVEYVRYQPSSSPRAYWQATVTKMQKIFGAPIPDAQVGPLVDYLTRAYGSEQGQQIVLPTKGLPKQ
jgi:sulfite dehydrogenase